MKKPTMRTRLINFANKHPEGFTVAQAREGLKSTSSRCSVLLWKMKKDGELTHDAKTKQYKLTGVNKAPALPAAPKAEKPIVLAPKGSYERENTDLKFQVAQLRNELARMDREQANSVAIIRYLEDKLFKAIQHDARNGRNA
jgi:hypothetical protein